MSPQSAVAGGTAAFGCDDEHACVNVPSTRIPTRAARRPPGMSPPDTLENGGRILPRSQKRSARIFVRDRWSESGLCGSRHLRFAVQAAGESETCAIDQREEGLVLFVAFSRAFFSCTRVPLRVPYIASFPSWQAYSLIWSLVP